MNEARKIEPAETQRTYRFPKGDLVNIFGVCELSVSNSGTHRLKTVSGHLHIVPAGWIHIEIDAKDWSF